MKITNRFGVLTLLVLLAAATRLMPHPPNFTAMGALALFGGAYFLNRLTAFVLPLATLFVSDLVLNNVVYAAFNDGKFVWFYEGAAWIYGSFAATIALSWFLLRRVDAVLQFLHSPLVDVETQRWIYFSKLNGQRQANVAQANDCDVCGDR